MPEFIPEHTPAALDSFTMGYLEAAEWLLDEDVDRETVTGFADSAMRAAVADCEAFQTANEADLAKYEELTGRDSSHAGHDFWLTRNGHGAGFWDRELLPELRGEFGMDSACSETLARLSEASRAVGSCETYIGDDDQIWFFGREGA